MNKGRWKGFDSHEMRLSACLGEERGRMKYGRGFVGLAICCLMIAFSGLIQEAGAGDSDRPWMSRVVSIQGRVLARRQGATDWRPVGLNDTFFIGDQIMVGANSRAGLVLSNDAVIRLDQNTTLMFTRIEQTRNFILELLKGAAHFFSHWPRSLTIVTPFVNGVVEGTEFFVQVDEAQTRIDLFEGRIRAANPYGELQMARGEGAVASVGQAPQSRILIHPRDSVQWALYYPPILTLSSNQAPDDYREAVVLGNQGRLIKALERLDKAAPEEQDSRFFVYRAGLLLQVGRVNQARADIQQALKLNASDADALALQAVIAVIQNRKDVALAVAQTAVQRHPRSAAAQIALSYAHQATFRLPEALQDARVAVSLAPGNSMAWARLAELQLSTGELDQGIESARKAAALDPHLAHAHTMLGFAYLTRMNTQKARKAFNQAIALDSAAPLPRLGLGLSTIRDGDLEAGRREIEIAAGLDAGNALIRSYLGKAYFDEKRDPADEHQFEIAKRLDPNDPTPWFYDAIRKQTLNRPVEALHDLQQSIQRNDNRAVYRSRLMLDEDLAARGASLGKLFNDLGFQELAFSQGWRSLAADPTNYSAHRLLADTLGAQPGHEIARVSELLQAQLLQPTAIEPVQPQLSESSALMMEGSGPASASYNEYSPLFDRNRLAAQFSGLAGSNRSVGDEITLSGQYNRLSCSAGQFYYKTNGFRNNNDLDQHLYDFNMQAALTPAVNLQAEVRHRDQQHGDLEMYWELDNPLYPDLRFDQKTDTYRIGSHFKAGIHADILASLIYQDMHQVQSVPGYAVDFDSEGYIGELQYLYRRGIFDLILGGGHYRLDTTILWDIYGKDDSNVKHSNGYFYTHLRYPEQLTWTIGASYDDLQDPIIGDKTQFNPKFGALWRVGPKTTLRGAMFKVMKRSLVADQTIEPTQVAGFNQLYDDFNGTESTLYGAAIDQRISPDLSGGLEYDRRLLRKFMAVAPEQILEEGWDEKRWRAYLYWTPADHVALSADYTYDRFEREFDTVDQNPSEQAPFEMKTHQVPLKLSYFHPSGFFSSLKTTYVHQEVRLVEEPEDTKKDDFALVDLAAGYRLPRRFGILSAEIRNLFDRSFKYVDTARRTSQISEVAPFVPERTFFVRLSLSF